MAALAQTLPGPSGERQGHISQQPAILEFRMFKLDPDKNWTSCLFIGSFVCVLGVRS
jgi:hypothetical protein